MAVIIKTGDEIALIKESCVLASKTMGEVATHIGEGKRTIEIDKIAEEFIRDHGGVPAFLNYNGFPRSLCISINSEVVHGIPSDRVIKAGDIVSVDCGVLLNGFYGDMAYTFQIGDVDEKTVLLMKATKDSLYKGIAKAIHGNRVGDIGWTIQTYVESLGYGVVREMVGHGVGRQLHEDPQVPNYGKKGQGVLLKKGMVIAIEPMINMGKKEVKQLSDGWTVVTIDGKPSAHFEHTVAVDQNVAQILTSFEYIENNLK